MKKLFWLLPLLALAAPVPATSADGRIGVIYYSPDRIVSITGHRSIQTMIEFGPDEHIENIALGDSTAWQVTPNKRANLIFVKPLMANAQTNMTVVTDKHRYLFDLTVGRPGSRGLFAIRFIYPEDFKLAEAAAQPIEPAPPPPQINSRWEVKGDRTIHPASIYDDGNSTFIAWSDTSELPAILTTGTDGKEGPVNFTVRGDYLVVDGVAPRYVLRIGKASATLTNLAPRAPKPVTPLQDAPKQAVVGSSLMQESVK
jgi:type IV secretion system protein VirB9